MTAMLAIGAFARLGRVSIRTLRHYDDIGLLRPARVNDATGYRSYHAGQLRELHQIVLLKDLGFTLHQVAEIVHERVDAAQLHEMLRLRRAAIVDRIAADLDRLEQVAAGLRSVEAQAA